MKATYIASLTDSWRLWRHGYVVFPLTAYLCQNWKEYSSHATAMKIYRVEAVGLRSYNFKLLEKLRFLWICYILTRFLKTRYFANNFLIKVRIWELILHMLLLWLWLSYTQQSSFLPSWFLVKYKFSILIFAFFRAESPSVT